MAGLWRAQRYECPGDVYLALSKGQLQKAVDVARKYVFIFASMAELESGSRDVVVCGY